MASLVLSGDTSGSITVSAPAVAGSSTQTLVAVTDTLAPIVRGTAITLTNQTAPAFTDIPSWVKRITLMLSSVQTSGTAPPIIQLGTGSTPTYTTSGYGGTNAIVLTNTAGALTFTSGFGIGVSTANWGGTVVVHGAITISNLTGNTWVASGSVGRSDNNSVYFTTGSIALGATLTAVRLFIDGTQFFDGGTINILYE
jgi:hypothetical protein